MSDIVLLDGTVIDATTGQPRVQSPKYVEVPTESEARRIVANTRRKLVDLPDVPARLNPLSVVMTYTLLGIGDDEIAVAMSTTVEQIARVKMTDAYARLYNQLVDSIVDTDTADVRLILADAARGAARNIVDAAVQNEDKNLKFSASKDILDRSGNRPVDVIEHRVRMEGGLRIEFVKKGEVIDVPAVTIDGDV